MPCLFLPFPLPFIYPSQHHDIASIELYCISFRPFFHVGIISVLAMTSNSVALGALVLVPIAIAIFAAFIALKTSHLSHKAATFLRNLWDDWYPWSATRQTRRRRKLRRSNLPSHQLYNDSWCDLQSVDSREGVSRFIDQTPKRQTSAGEGEHQEQDTVRRIWHPSRSTRLNWGFTNPRSLSPHLFELSNVAKPSPVAQRQENRSVEDAEDHLVRLFTAREARRFQRTDP